MLIRCLRTTGIGHWGHSTLLLPISLPQEFFYSRNVIKPLINKRDKMPRPSSEYLSLSPLYFSTGEQLLDMLKKYKQRANKNKGMKGFGDTSQANKPYEDNKSHPSPDTTLGPLRASFEHSR